MDNMNEQTLKTTALHVDDGHLRINTLENTSNRERNQDVENAAFENKTFHDEKLTHVPESLDKILMKPMGKRKESDVGEIKRSTAKKKRVIQVERLNKGLRHFSLKVSQKVEQKQHTTYNEVADDLVKDCIAERPESVEDEKNIRRRVYDALNVLMALDVISKEKKDIKWKGLPINSSKDLENLMMEKQNKLQRVEQKKEQLQELLLQQISFQNLVRRNKEKASPSMHIDENTRLELPFIIVNTDQSTVIQCEMSEDRSDVFFNFSSPFEINDENEILRRLNIHKVSKKDLDSFLPANLISFLPKKYLQEVGDHL